MDLQKMKRFYSKAQIEDFNGIEVITVSKKHLDWLIEQAEKVEGVEERLKELAQSDYCIMCGDNATEVRQGRFYCHECCN